jgi:hypothetical protein
MKNSDIWEWNRVPIDTHRKLKDLGMKSSFFRYAYKIHKLEIDGNKNFEREED